jgi:CGNR zinc finger
MRLLTCQVAYSGYMNVTDEQLLELLNSAPVVHGAVVERLDDPTLRPLRDDLHAVIRGMVDPAVLGRYLRGVRRVPEVGAAGIEWTLEGSASALHAARYVLAWSEVERDLPGRLRACANDECNKFLIDHSKPNSARWCSMAECGNRMKARRHHARSASNAGASARPA